MTTMLDSQPDPPPGSHRSDPPLTGDRAADGAPAVTVHRDLMFAPHPTGDLVMDLYRPQVSGTVPVVLWIHGGGWFTGDRTLCPNLAQRASAAGLAYASIEYRLSGEATYPAQLHDVQAAVRHLRDNAQKLDLNPDRIGLWGASAGGHLALMVTAAGSAETGTGAEVQAVAVSYPPTDLTVNVNGDDGEARDPKTPEARLLGAAPSSAPKRARAASPLFHAHDRWPPTQISHGTADSLVTWEQSQRMHQALRGVGVPSELYLVENYRHGFLNPAGRLDVEMAKIMDDGRLEAEGWAAATLQTRADGPPQNTTFGFATVDAFFRAHLIER